MNTPFPNMHQSSYIQVSRNLMINLSAQLGHVSEQMMLDPWVISIYRQDGRIIQNGILDGAMRRKDQHQAAIFVPIRANYSSEDQEAEFGNVLTLVIHNDERVGQRTRRTSHFIVCEDDLASLLV